MGARGVISRTGKGTCLQAKLSTRECAKKEKIGRSFTDGGEKGVPDARCYPLSHLGGKGLICLPKRLGVGVWEPPCHKHTAPKRSSRRDPFKGGNRLKRRAEGLRPKREKTPGELSYLAGRGSGKRKRGCGVTSSKTWEKGQKMTKPTWAVAGRKGKKT